LEKKLALTISTNTASISAQRHWHNSRADLNTAMERLSSVKRINSAGDDSAGLAIRDKMTSQIKGLNQAVRNANDAVSLLQAAEGGMEEVTTILQRMRTLAVQASNDTNTSSDRQNITDEIMDLSAEINRVSDTSTFNNQNLLNGNFNGTFQVGAKSREAIDLTIKDFSTNKIGTAGDGLVAYKVGSEFQVNTTTTGAQPTPNVY
jgi:flagellin